MGKLSLLLTCFLATMFGLLGAVGGLTLLADDLKGEQGATGITGAPGEPGQPGADGIDGSDGSDGARGRRGRRGPGGEPAPTPTPTPTPTYGLGTSGCSGQAFTVVTDVTIENERVRATKSRVCVTE